MVQDINKNQDPKELDFLGNDLFLIVETHEELINSLIGCYAKLDYDNKGSDVYLDKIISLRKLKLELAMRNHDIQFKKQTIIVLENELKEVKVIVN